MDLKDHEAFKPWWPELERPAMKQKQTRSCFLAWAVALTFIWLVVATTLLGDELELLLPPIFWIWVALISVGEQEQSTERKADAEALENYSDDLMTDKTRYAQFLNQFWMNYRKGGYRWLNGSHAATSVYLTRSSDLKFPHQRDRIFFAYPRWLQEAQNRKLLDTFLRSKGRKWVFKRPHSNIERVHHAVLASRDMIPKINAQRSIAGYGVGTMEAVISTAKSNGVRLVTPATNDWNIIWTMGCPRQWITTTHRHQKINRFPGTGYIGAKEQHARLVQEMRNRYEAKFPGQSDHEFFWMPKTYLLPKEYALFENDRMVLQLAGAQQMYIKKPAHGWGGKGITIIGPEDDVPNERGYVVQEYISNPHLIEGRKYDLRIYVLVTSFNPLRIYLFPEGRAIFCPQKYDNEDKNIANHVTNAACCTRTDFERRWTYTKLTQHLRSMGMDVSKVQSEMRDLIIKAFIAPEPIVSDAYNKVAKHPDISFQLFGLDVLLDEQLRPHMMEINTEPALHANGLAEDTPEIYALNQVLIRDVYNIVGVVAFDKEMAKETADPYVAPKKVNGVYQYTGDERMNKILTAALPDRAMTSKEFTMIQSLEEEFERKGNFDRIYPLRENCESYDKYFQFNRPSNALVASYLKNLPEGCNSILETA